MARKNKLQEAGAEVFDSLFSVSPEKAPETSQAESSREPEKTAQGADKKPKKKVFSFRAGADQADSWRVWADAKGMKVDELGETAIMEYISRNPLTEDQQKIYELKLAQKSLIK